MNAKLQHLQNPPTLLHAGKLHHMLIKRVTGLICIPYSMHVLFCIHVIHLCILHLYFFGGIEGLMEDKLFLLNVLPSENKDYYYYL